MKKIFVIICFFFVADVVAQQSFEGTIKYTLRVPGEKDTIQMNIDFAAHAIKVNMVEPRRERRNNDYLLINLDSGKAYTVNYNHKSFTSHRLIEKKPVSEVPPIKTIAGYTAVGELYNEAGVNSIFGSLLSNKTIFYTADKLTYSVPEKYNGNFELMMIQKDKIVLGAEIDIAPRLGIFGRPSDEDDSTMKTTVFIEAKEIVAKKFEADYFRLPGDFARNRPYVYIPDSLDSITMSMDTAVAYYTDTIMVSPKKPVIKKTKKSPAKKASQTKQNAVIRKND